MSRSSISLPLGILSISGGGTGYVSDVMFSDPWNGGAGGTFTKNNATASVITGMTHTCTRNGGVLVMPTTLMGSSNSSTEYTLQIYLNGVAVGSLNTVRFSSGQRIVHSINHKINSVLIGDVIDVRCTRSSGSGTVTIRERTLTIWMLE